jgi:hypothetical protein
MCKHFSYYGKRKLNCNNPFPGLRDTFCLRGNNLAHVLSLSTHSPKPGVHPLLFQSRGSPQWERDSVHGEVDLHKR